MLTLRRLRARGEHPALAIGLFVALAGPAAAQTSARPAPVGAAAGVDVTSQYVFRGVRQNATGVAVRPFADLELTPYSGDGMLEQVIVRGGFWNSLNSGDTGAGGPADAAWYESRLSGSLSLRLAGGVTLASSFTAYNSPNEMFTTVKELGLRVGWNDRDHRLSLNPYAALAVELDAEPGRGQLDGGPNAGRYLEIGAAPTYTARRARVAIPVAVGLSLRDYYELSGRDHAFGFLSVGASLTVPLGTTLGGRWSLRGGVEAQRLGETTRVFNGGDRTLLIGSVGLAVSR